MMEARGASGSRVASEGLSDAVRAAPGAEADAGASPASPSPPQSSQCPPLGTPSRGGLGTSLGAGFSVTQSQGYI